MLEVILLYGVLPTAAGFFPFFALTRKFNGMIGFAAWAVSLPLIVFTLSIFEKFGIRIPILDVMFFLVVAWIGGFVGWLVAVWKRRS